MELEINGKKYRRIEPKTKKESPASTSRMLGIAMMMAISFSMYGGSTRRGYESERPQVDIVKEFELIEQKKSFLSSNQRRWVVQQFHKNFKEVSEEELKAEKETQERLIEQLLI